GDVRLIGVDVVEFNIVGFEHDLPPSCDACLDQVAEDFMLRVNRNRAATSEAVQINPVRLSVEAQVDAPLDEPFAEQALADAAFDEQIHGALFENAGADGGFHSLARANLQHHRVHAAQMKQMRKQ